MMTPKPYHLMPRAEARLIEPYAVIRSFLWLAAMLIAGYLVSSSGYFEIRKQVSIKFSILLAIDIAAFLLACGYFAVLDRAGLWWSA